MWLPYGDLATDKGYERGVVYLKGNFSNTPGGGMLGAIRNATMPNPSIGVYVSNTILGIPETSSSESFSSSSSLGLILGLSIGLGVLAVVVVGLLVALVVRRRQVGEDERYAPLSVALKRADEMWTDHGSGDVGVHKGGGSDDGSLGMLGGVVWGGGKDWWWWCASLVWWVDMLSGDSVEVHVLFWCTYDNAHT